MIFRITASKEDVSLDTLSRSSNLVDYNMVPVSRSYNGGDWERVAGPYAQDLAISACDDNSSCKLVIPLLPNLNEGKYILMSFQHSINAKEEVSRFLHQATFGPTVEMIDGFDYNSLPDAMASFVSSQIYSTPATYHREYFRKRIDGYVSSAEETQEYGESPMLKARNPCDKGSRWAEFAFSADDYGKDVEVTARSSGDFLVSVGGVPRTIMSQWKNTDEIDLRTGQNWYMSKLIYLNSLSNPLLPLISIDLSKYRFDINIGYYTEEVVGGDMLVNDSQTGNSYWIKGGNPPVDLAGIVHEDIKFLDLPAITGFDKTSPVTGGLPWQPEFQFGETLILSNALPRSQCTNEGISYTNTVNIVGNLAGSDTQVRYARYLELDENTIDHPIPNGGGNFVDDGGTCSNPSMDFMNGKFQLYGSASFER